MKNLFNKFKQQIDIIDKTEIVQAKIPIKDNDDKDLVIAQLR